MSNEFELIFCWCADCCGCWCIVPIDKPIKLPPLLLFAVWWLSICCWCWFCAWARPIISDTSEAAAMYAGLPNDVTSAILSRLSDRTHCNETKKKQTDTSTHAPFKLVDSRFFHLASVFQSISLWMNSRIHINKQLNENKPNREKKTRMAAAAGIYTHA